MIISPPFLPVAGITSSNIDITDPMMDAVDKFELAHGIYPVAFDRRWHTGVHLMPTDQNERVRAIADGEVVAYRVCQKAIDGGEGVLDSNPGFVLLKHTTETGEGRPITFYSLYMHLLDLESYTKPQIDSLPKFLRTPTPDEGQAGSGKKVYRKDVLGLPGRCHGQRHIHFEIFMLPGDFDAYFGSTQLDNKQPATPSHKDYWGHSYFIIPADQQFKDKPTGLDATNKPRGIEFETLVAGSNQGYALHVEAYFHKGNKYTSTWRVEQDGTRTLLTPTPAKETGYEYDLLARAKSLYPGCPSDGYELLRFGGRILSDHPTLPDGATNTPASFAPDLPGDPDPASSPGPRTTWIRVTYAQGQEGYININAPGIVKLSDADFPSFTGWQKISEGNTPYSDDAMCDIDELKKIIGDVAPKSADAKEYEDEDALGSYIGGSASVQAALRGFICEAPTEWNKTHNETRYAKLNEPDEFYGKQQKTNPDGYKEFLNLLEKFQFWGKTQLPEGKLWYFHPLQFIRHFRKCAWLSADEFKQLLPMEVLRESGSTVFYEPVPAANAVGSIARNHRVPLNKMLRKYNITTPNRISAILGNSLQETQWLGKLHEDNSNMWYYPWDGRGFLQLTHPGNYIDYWDFRGRGTQISRATRDAISRAHRQADLHRDHAKSYISDSVSGATQIMIQWREDVGDNDNMTRDLLSPTDSAGFYWSAMRMATYADKDVILERRTVQAKRPPDKHHPNAPNPLVTKIYYHSMAFRDASAAVNLPAAVGDPDRSFNGYIARCVAYAQVLAVLGDMFFPDASGESLLFPEDRTPRRN
ncbi:M23 family metallopeptidase [Burkholderia ubonensis]|uniref:Uncharacterized protein n=1 Tax=Burkholderia ubonensis TaxID=101571 RepID=A0A1R1JBS1_9BURK|nr:M23 family metallopeptidase [Burkholderia ubonensis]OMG72763.1 hypothetical protein BW685_13760 [Burkholderia ubonensis]